MKKIVLTALCLAMALLLSGCALSAPLAKLMLNCRLRTVLPVTVPAASPFPAPAAVPTAEPPAAPAAEPDLPEAPDPSNGEGDWGEAF